MLSIDERCERVQLLREFAVLTACERRLDSCVDGLGDRLDDLNSLLAVSYTHLDVYKRQDVESFAGEQQGDVEAGLVDGLRPEAVG